MNESYEELSRRATKGDEIALRELFALPEQYNGEKNFQDAAVAFRDAAIAYRISAFRNLARAEDAENRAAWSSVVRNIFKRWIDDNPSGLRELPYCAQGVTRDCIRDVVVIQLLHEESFALVFLFLEESVSSMGMQFFSPGGRIQRRVWWLLGEVFGLEGGEGAKYLRDISVRVGLDLIADEVAKRCRTAQLNAPEDAPQTARP